MTRGPLPNPEKRRRNAPTIPTTALPAGGHTGRIPRSPYSLGSAGAAWWKWAWRTPQAAAWSAGDLFAVARRAQLEDDVSALECDGLGPIPDGFDDLAEYLDNVKFVVQHLKALAGGKLAVIKEMRELDDRLGLTPKAMASLRWSITEDAAKPSRSAGSSSTARLRVVDSAS